MALTVTAKVTNIRSLAEARFCAGMGVEILSFQLNDNGLPLEEAAGITGWLAGVKIAVDAIGLPEENLKQQIEFLQPSYITVSESQLISWQNQGDPGFILQLSDVDLLSIQNKINIFKDSAEFFEISYQSIWIENGQEDLFIEISNNSRIMVAFHSLDELDDLFRTGKIFRSISLNKSNFKEDDFRKAIEMFEEMD
jgi:phosphoribosylanthranilate isomerase